MSKTLKKLLASALAATMLFSTAVTAFADSTTKTLSGSVTAGTVEAESGATTVKVPVTIALKEKDATTDGVVAPQVMFDMTIEGGTINAEETYKLYPVSTSTYWIEAINGNTVIVETDIEDTAVYANVTVEIVVDFATTPSCATAVAVDIDNLQATNYDEADWTDVSAVDGSITVKHTEEEIPAVDATCTETGLTAGTKCSVCDAVIVAQETVDALGHNYVDGVCSVCGAADPDYVPECDHADATLTYDKETGLYTKTCECGYTDSFEPVVADTAISVPFTAKTLDLNDSIGLIYYIAASSVAGADDFYLNVDHKLSDGSGNSKNNVNIEGTYSAGYGGEYKFAYPDVAAKEMMDIIYATIYVVKDGYIYSTTPVTFNPRDYVDAKIGSLSATGKTLVVDMLNYGAEAQKMFSYNTDNLANAGLDEAYLALGTSEVPSMTNSLDYGDNTQTVKHSIPTISLENKVEIVYYLADPTAAVEDVNNLSLVVECNGSTTVIPWSDFEYVASYKEYKASFAGLAAKQMGLVAEFTMYENYGTDSQVALSSTMKYSIESYATKWTAANGQIYNTSIAMIRYGRSALAFFGA